MAVPLDEQYLTWLYARIGSIRDTRPSMTYWSLFRQLFTTEFVWFIPNDDNRVEDGRALREEFLDETGLSRDVDPNWLGMGCSVLELIFGLASHLSFQMDRTPRFWFLQMLENLGLNVYTDREYDGESVADIVNTLIWRTYAANGRGGLFPLADPPEDQRDVELWYQLCAYVLERD